MRPLIMHRDTDNAVLCFTDPKLDKGRHTAAEPGGIVSTAIQHLHHGHRAGSAVLIAPGRTSDFLSDRLLTKKPHQQKVDQAPTLAGRRRRTDVSSAQTARVRQRRSIVS